MLRTTCHMSHAHISHVAYHTSHVHLDRKNLRLIDNVMDLDAVRTVQQVYEVLQEDDYDVAYHRLPIVDGEDRGRGIRNIADV